jgi:hypothetical protein
MKKRLQMLKNTRGFSHQNITLQMTTEESTALPLFWQMCGHLLVAEAEAAFRIKLWVRGE